MQTTFRQTTGLLRPSALAVWAALILSVIALLAFLVFEHRNSGEFPWDSVIFGVAFLSFGLLVSWLIGPGARRILTLDDQGLNYALHRTNRRWNWADLSTAEIRVNRPWSDPYVRIRVDDIDREARWSLMESLCRSEISLHAIYDAPLQNICDRLNEYRDRALGGQCNSA